MNWLKSLILLKLLDVLKFTGRVKRIFVVFFFIIFDINTVLREIILILIIILYFLEINIIF